MKNIHVTALAIHDHVPTLSTLSTPHSATAATTFSLIATTITTLPLPPPLYHYTHEEKSKNHEKETPATIPRVYAGTCGYR